MEPTEALAAEKPTRTDATAPAAAHWLNNPTDTTRQPTQAELWEAEPQWTGPALTEEEQP